MKGRDPFHDSKPWVPPELLADPKPIERRKGPKLPPPEQVLDAIADDYVRTMEAQGHIVDAAGRAAIKRMANIHYAFYCATVRALA